MDRGWDRVGSYQRHFKKETSMNIRKPRGRPFEPGNSGRPAGSKNRTTQLLKQLADGEAEQIIQKVLEKAKAGDDACLRMLMDRLWPPRKGQPVKLNTPPLKTSADVLTAIVTLWTAIANGHLTPDEASALSLVAERSMAVINQQEALKRIEGLEKDQERRDATNIETD
jgi:hypothetical protein